MKENSSPLNIIFGILKNDTKLKIIGIVLLMLISSMFEILSIGAVIPLISLIIDPEILNNITQVNQIEQVLKINLDAISAKAMLFIFIVIILLTTIFKVLVLKGSLYMSKIITAEIGSKVFEKLIYSSYEDLINLKSTSFSGTMTQRLDSLSALLFHFLNVLSSILFLIILMITMTLSGLGKGILVILPIVIFYIILGLYSKKKLDKNSIKLNSLITSRLKTLNDVYNSIRDIILNFAQESYNNIFKNYEFKFRKIEAKVSFIMGSARYMIEGVAIITLVSIVMFLMYLGIENKLILVVTGTIVFATQRFLPFFQQMFVSWSNFYGHLDQINQIAEMVAQNNKNQFLENNYDYKKFQKKIILKNVSYKYPDTEKYILKNINIEVNRGDKVAIRGKTGAGKTTLVDIILGLIRPVEGFVIIDDNKLEKKHISSWIKNISHVPQEIFLIDDTIEANIFFPSKRNFSTEELNKAAKIAEVLEFSEKKEYGLKQMVGENGINLSGGQKQRIGLARAFVKKREIIILDEATNQLDKETEKKIFENIKSNFANHTIFAISHNDNNLDFFDKIIDLDQI